MKLKTNRLKKVIENNSSQSELIRQTCNWSYETDNLKKKQTKKIMKSNF